MYSDSPADGLFSFVVVRPTCKGTVSVYACCNAKKAKKMGGVS